MTSPQRAPAAASKAAKIERVQRPVRLDPALWAGLDALAKAQGVSTNALMEAVGKRLVGVGQSEPKGKGDPIADALREQLKAADMRALLLRATRAGKTVGAWVTDAVRSLLAQEGLPALPAAADGEGQAIDRRKVTIRLRHADKLEIQQQAAAMGTTLTGWITALARSRIRKAPLLAVPETAALAEANKQLAAVGRNLNTVVHRLHREGRWAGNLDLYAELLASVKAVRARVEAVIAAGQARAEDD